LKGTTTLNEEMIHILLVEDSFDYADMLCIVLADQKLASFKIDHVGLLDQAIKRLNDDKHDVILLDLILPDSSGLETFRTVHALTPDIPIVVMTALDDKELALKAVREGAQDFLVKGELEVNQLVRSIQYSVERNRTLAHIKRLSIIDDLTGLLNRRGFLSLAKQQMKIAQRANRNLLLFFADLDSLKEINDNFGHPEGDQALKSIAKILRDTFRSSDLVARLGGDEFTILAVDAPKNTAESMTSRLQEHIKNYNLKNHRYQISLSIGVSRFDPQSDVNLDELIARADKALYKQKRKTKDTPDS
jgi:two-component system cell cycle response regulator